MSSSERRRQSALLGVAPRSSRISLWGSGRLATFAALIAVLAGCGAQGARPERSAEETRAELLTLERAPYMGVSCQESNWIACDRVGLAVWLAKPAVRLEASIAGREVEMKSPGVFVGGRGTGWEGHLQPAGLHDGALRVVPDRGREFWEGRNPVEAEVRITAHFANGSSASRTVRVSLQPGWG